MRKKRAYALLTLKGLAMGAADVVPGVSGGTIAFISGIYEELIETLTRFNLKAIQILKQEGVGPAWKYINGNFLVALFLGIGISLVSLSRGITWLLKNEPIAMWSFFLGLVFASIFLMGKEIKKWRIQEIIAFIAGAAIAWFITSLPAVENPDSLVYIFFSGAIAICAMILPGISGSFILVLLGSYATVLNSISTFNFAVIFTFAAGAIIGLLSFSKALKWMFKHYYFITMSLLTGFLLGSLNKLWPWKKTETFFVKHPGTEKEQIVPILQSNILPGEYAEITGIDPQVGLAVALFIAGSFIIVGLEYVAARSKVGS